MYCGGLLGISELAHYTQYPSYLIHYTITLIHKHKSNKIKIGMNDNEMRVNESELSIR